ncbi:MAG: hypothetical protein BMS9Abin37_2197 [Acidobacteriota bacterium]|nr:MAG: hypothetical protein BMS9Abin37_2197 [Acidobacteriota bacterium]
MAQSTFEERLEALEEAVAQLTDRSQPNLESKDWRSTVGMFANDPVMKEIQEEGRKIREAERRDAQS